MNAYPAIEDHGLTGDLQTAALVSRDGAIDWFCAPRFDSPSIFAALLDHRRGGHFRIAPVDIDHVSKQLYLPGTPILITRFLSAAGVGEVIDFMPIAGEQATDRHRLVRLVRVVRGQMRFRVDCQPRFNYGRDGHEADVTPDGALFRSGSLAVTLNVARRDRRLASEQDVRLTKGGVEAVVALSAADIGGIVLETASGGPPRVVSPEEIVAMFDETRDFWRGWNWSPTASSTATTPAPPRTACAAPKAASRYAASGTSTRWPDPDASTRPGSPSRRCSPTATTLACTRRRSRRPASRSATSPRPSATSP